MNSGPRRGDIWWVDLADAGIRPAVIVTSDGVLPRLLNVTLIPVTSTIRGVDTEVELTPEENGVDLPCVANCHNIQTVPKASLLQLISRADADTMNAIDEAIHLALDLP